jgi:hypothetical protein
MHRVLGDAIDPEPPSLACTDCGAAMTRMLCSRSFDTLIPFVDEGFK